MSWQADPDDDTVSFGRSVVLVAVGDLVAGRYRLEQKVGRGASGVVFRARDERLERVVALKVLGAGLADAEGSRRLLREARAVARLSHPNIVGVFDVGESGDGEGNGGSIAFLVLEWLEGVGLDRWQPQSLEAVIDVACQLCAALDHAHRNQLVHRDLKPENVLLVAGESVSGSQVKLVDLGLARGHDGSNRLTKEGEIAGTVLYMAPEQALGHDVDGRADLYSLGAVLYQLVTGRPPFTGPDALSILTQHLTAPPVSPRRWRTDLTPALESIILRLLEKQPAERFASAEEVRRALADATAPAAEEDTPRRAALPVLGRLDRRHLVGRADLLQRLHDSWRYATSGGGDDGHGAVVLLAGEPGAGKSRLAKELAGFVRLRGGEVLSGGSYEHEAATPYLPFVEALRRWTHRRSDDELRSLLGCHKGADAEGDLAADLARLAPEIEARLGPFPERPTTSQQEGRLRLFDAVARFLRARAGSSGLLLFLDDLQWADRGTLALVHDLQLQLRGAPVLILGAYRDVELETAPHLADHLATWRREPGFQELAVERLSSRDTAALVDALLGQEGVATGFAERVHAETEGNPLFVEELVKTLVAEGQIVQEQGTWRLRVSRQLTLPRGVRAVLRQRIERIGEGSRGVLRTAAVLGKHFEFAELAAVSDVGEEALLDALDEALAAQLLTSTGGESFRFSHDKIREVLLDEVNPVRRKRLHARVAEGLERLAGLDPGVVAADLAFHWIEAGRAEQGLRWAERAGALASAVHAHDEALRLYRQALACAEELGDVVRRVELTEAIARVYRHSGDLKQSMEHLRAGIDLCQLAAGSPAASELRRHLFSLLGQLGESQVTVGDLGAAATVQPVLDAADADPALQSSALLVVARHHHLTGRSGRARDTLVRALDLAPEDSALRAIIFQYLSGADQHLARLDDSDEWARRCGEMGERLGDLGLRCLGYEFQAENEAGRGRWPEAQSLAQTEVDMSRQVRALLREGWGSWVKAQSLMHQGRLRQADEAFHQVIELSHRLGEIRLEGLAAMYRAVGLAEMGRFDEARATVDPWCRRVDEMGLLYHRVEARRVQTFVAWLAGDPAAGLARFDEARGLLEGSEESLNPIFAMPAAAEAALDAGDVARAEALASEARSRCVGAGVVHWLAIVERVDGRLAGRRGDLAAARGCYDEAVRLSGRVDARLELARSLERRAALGGADGAEDAERARSLRLECGAVS